MAALAQLSSPSFSLRAARLEAPVGVRAAFARLGPDELLVLDRPAPAAAAGAAATRACGERLEALRAIHACYAPVASDADWLRGVLRELAPLAPSARWFARLDGLAAGGEADILLPDGAAVPDGAAAAILDAVGLECYRDLVRPRPPVQLLSHRLRSLPPAVEHRVASILSARGVPDAVLLLGGELDGRAVALGMLLAPGIRAPSRTVGVLRRVAAHLETARRLREQLRPGDDGPPEGEPGARSIGELPIARSIAELAMRSIAELTVARLDRDGALVWCDAAEAARRWASLGDGSYALLDHWRAGGRLRLLARRCEDGGDPAALRHAELEVVAEAVRGAPNDAIAARLAIAGGTVALHLASARARLRCASRRELVALLGDAEPGPRAAA